MNWKLKALVQNIIANLPLAYSNKIYYWIQRNFGGLSSHDPMFHLRYANDFWNKFQSLNFIPEGKTFFEIGTGRSPTIPLGLILLGAKLITTIDINAYIETDYIEKEFQSIFSNKQAVKKILGSNFKEDIFNTLADFFFSTKPFSPADFFRFARIDYQAPVDTTNTFFSPESFDFIISRAVLEHIPPLALKSVLKEGSRILKKGGAALHLIDYSDHFSHSDPSISAINFLSFSASQWNFIAGNQFMYCNRLRHDDFLKLFGVAGFKIIEALPTVDREVYSSIRSGYARISNPFRGKSLEVLATTSAWIASIPIK